MESLPHTSGIYQIVCTLTGKVYIGSSKDINNRWRVHLYELTKQIHHSYHLQRAWDKYGADAFQVSVVELVLEPFLDDREAYWFKKLKCADRKYGFNIAPQAGSNRNVVWSEESRKRASLAKLGHKGTPVTEENKRRASERMKGQKIWVGRKHRPESIEKMRQSKIGKPEPPAAAIAKVEATAKEYIVTDPEGNEYLIKNMSEHCRKHGLWGTTMVAMARGRHGIKQHKGWKCRYP